MKVTATDGTGASGSATFTWTVNAAHGDGDQPGPSRPSIQNGEVSLQIAASDSAAGQALTYSATGLPAGLSISSSGQISGRADHPRDLQRDGHGHRRHRRVRVGDLHLDGQPADCHRLSRGRIRPAKVAGTAVIAQRLPIAPWPASSAALQ